MPKLQNFHARSNFNKWLSGDPCKRIASGLERKAAFETRHSTQVKVARLGKEKYKIFDSESEDDLLGQKNEKDEKTTFTIKAPTTEDQQEAEGVNEEEKRGVVPLVKIKSQK